MATAGYNAVRWMREREKEKRGGQAKHDDGLDHASHTMAAHLDRHLDWMRAHHRSEGGITSRYQSVLYFLQWAQQRDLVRAEQITRSILESYQRYLYSYRKKNGQPLGISTQHGRLNSLRLFFSWLCKERLLEANPASEIELPPIPRRLPKDILSVAEIEAVLAVPDITDQLGIRDRAILELFYSTGIRRSELVRLQLGDINAEKRTLFIRQGKGHKDRVVPVGVRAMIWLEKYLADVRPLLLNQIADRSLFLSGYGEGFSANVLSRRVRRYISEAGIGRASGGTHLFRHSCATHMLEGGADIRYIQQLLGHACLETTAIYTQVSIQQLQAIHAQTHPAEQREAAKKPSNPSLKSL